MIATRLLTYRPRRLPKQDGLALDSKAQAEQIRSVAVERIGERIGHLTAKLLTELDQAIRVHLNL